MKRACAPLALLACLVPLACGGSPPASAGAAAAPPAAAPALPPVDGQRVLADIKVISSDDYQGRAPGTKGEDLTVAWIENQFKQIGLQPGNTDGTYIQHVPLVGITPDPS